MRAKAQKSFPQELAEKAARRAALRLVVYNFCRLSYILELNDLFFVCLFVCLELIEKLARATDLKFGMRVEHVVATNKFQDQSDISTNF